jgi:glycosyltransferase involved in cell wall biosynthesis
MYRENNIWLVLDSRTNGGIETHVLELARGLDDYGLQVSVVFLKHYGHHPLHAALSEAGIETFSLDGSFSSLLNSIRKFRPALIHSHGYKAGISCCAAALSTGSAHVSTFHAGDSGKGKLALYDWLHRQTARFIDVNFSVSAEIAGRVPATTLVINNFISLPELAPKTGGQLAFVGRLSEEKGPDRLLAIAAQMERVEFDLYGDGPLMNSLKGSATANCCFHGNQADMAAHWCNIDLLIMPSRYEGLPMAALEAMARGIPVIAFDVGALDQVIESGENGWLIRPNDLDAFRIAIEHWLTLDSQQKDSIRDAARHRIASRFSVRKIAPLILEQYRRAAGSRFPACDAFCE